MSTLPQIFFLLCLTCTALHAMNTGTVLFVEDDLKKDCWSPANTRLLLTRMIMEDLLPSPSILTMVDDQLVYSLLEYIELVYHTINKEASGNRRHSLLMAFTDALGGYMRHMVLPNVKYSFYAGTIDYASVEKIQDLYKQTKTILKTNGHGWAEPLCDAECKYEPHSFGITCPKDCKSCEALTLFYPPRVQNDDGTTPSRYPDVAVPLPFFDKLIKPSVLAVPLKNYPLRGMRAPWGLNLVVTYYLTGYKCLARTRSPKAMKVFQNGVYTWMVEEVIPILGDEDIYTVFGGVLRVLATLKRLGAKKVDLNKLRNSYSHMSDAYVRKTSIWSFTKHRKIAVAILIFLFIWFMIGFCFICFKIRSRDGTLFGGLKAGSKSDQKKCECEGVLRGVLKTVKRNLKKTISNLTHRLSKSISRSSSRSSSPRKRDCTCFNVKQEIYHAEETEDESILEDDCPQRKTTMNEGPVCTPSYLFGYDFQTSTSESPTDSDSELEIRCAVKPIRQYRK